MAQHQSNFEHRFSKNVFLQPLADFRLQPSHGAMAMSELCVDVLIAWQPRNSPFTCPDELKLATLCQQDRLDWLNGMPSSIEHKITEKKPGEISTPFAKLFECLPAPTSNYLTSLAFIFSPLSYPSPHKRQEALARLKDAINGRQVSRTAPDVAIVEDQEWEDFGIGAANQVARIGATSFRPLCTNNCSEMKHAAMSDHLRLQFLCAIDDEIKHQLQSTLMVHPPALIHHINDIWHSAITNLTTMSATPISQSELDLINMWFERISALHSTLPPTVDDIDCLNASFTDLRANSLLPPLCSGLVKARAFLFRDEDIGFRPSVLREIALMRLLSADRRCLHVSLDQSTGGVLFILPRAPLKADADSKPSNQRNEASQFDENLNVRHNRLLAPSNRKSDVHLMWKLSWLYQYLAAIAYFHEHNVPYLRAFHPSLLMEGRCIRGLRKVVSPHPIVADGTARQLFSQPFDFFTTGLDLDAAAAHCFSGAVEVMCAGDAMPLGNILYQPPEVMLGGSRQNAKRTMAADMWVFACTIHHLTSDLFLFPINSETSEFAQLMEIFKLLGTPDEKTWPGVTKLPNYSSSFPEWSNSAWDAHFANSTVDPKAVKFMKKLFVCNPSQRLTAEAAMADEFFEPLRIAYSHANGGAKLPVGGDAFDLTCNWNFYHQQQLFYKQQLQSTISQTMSNLSSDPSQNSNSKPCQLDDDSDFELEVEVQTQLPSNELPQNFTTVNSLSAMMANGTVSRIGNHSSATSTLALMNSAAGTGAFVPMRLDKILAPDTPSSMNTSFFSSTPSSNPASSPGSDASSLTKHIKLENFSKLAPTLSAIKREQSRAMVVDWMIEVAREFKLSDDSLFLAVNILDRTLAAMACLVSEVQLIAEVALLIASKIVDCSRIVASEFAEISDNAYTTSQIKEMELQVLNALDMDIFQTTPLNFLRLLMVESIDQNTLRPEEFQKQTFLAQYLCECMLPSPYYISFEPMTVALAALSLAQDGAISERVWKMKGVKALLESHPNGHNEVGDGWHEFQMCRALMLRTWQSGVILNRSIHAPSTGNDAVNMQTRLRVEQFGKRKSTMGAARSKYARENLMCVAHLKPSSRLATHRDAFESLPTEVCSMILKFLPVQQRPHTALVSKRWRAVYCEWILWSSVDLESSADRVNSDILQYLASRLHKTEHLSLAACSITPTSLLAILHTCKKSIRSLNLTRTDLEVYSNGNEHKLDDEWLKARGLVSSTLPQRHADPVVHCGCLPGSLSMGGVEFNSVDSNMLSEVDVNSFSEILTMLQSYSRQTMLSLECLDTLILDAIQGLSCQDVCALLRVCPSLTALNFGHNDVVDRDFNAIFEAFRFGNAVGIVRQHGTQSMAIPMSPLAVASTRDLAHSCKLQRLELTACHFLTDASVVQTLQVCTQLKSLRLDECPQLTDATLRAMPATMVHLNMALNSNFTDAGVADLVRAATQLESLNMSFCFRLGNASLDAVTKLPKLVSLNCASLESITSVDTLCRLIAPKVPTNRRLTYLNVNGCTGISQVELKKLGVFFENRFKSCNGANEPKTNLMLLHCNISEHLCRDMAEAAPDLNIMYS